jgi:hypothetical protein
LSREEAGADASHEIPYRHSIFIHIPVRRIASAAVPEMSEDSWKAAVFYPSENEVDKPAHDLSEHRCMCGRLLFRLTAQGVSLKCQRCKRTAVLSLPGLMAQLSQLSARDPASSATAVVDLPSAAASTKPTKPTKPTKQ